MKAVVFSIGEATTDLCVWSLKRNGWQVVLYKDGTSLWQKLNRMFHEFDEDLIRVDGDIVVNRHLTESNLPKTKAWWVQFMNYDWYKQDLAHGGMNYIKQSAFPAIRKHINEFQYAERPETELYRLKEFHNPRRCITDERVMGLQNYQNSMRRVRETKQRRDQLESYDFELARKLNDL